MKRKIERMKSMLPTTEEVTEHSIYVDDSSSETSVSSAILGNVSPSSRKRAVKRLKLNPSLYESVKNKKRFDLIGIETRKKSVLQTKVEEFSLRDENSSPVPDIKKHKLGYRYRLL